MGRPPIGKVAMTVAERQRKRRAKLKDHVTEPGVTKLDLLDFVIGVAETAIDAGLIETTEIVKSR